MQALVRLGAWILGCAALVACGPSMGPKVRVATASAEELRKVEDEDNVWYEFQPGDVIPIQLAFMGVVEGGAREAVFRAKQHFYFVMFKNAPMQISFDGKTFAGPRGSQSLIAVVPREGGQGGKLGWFIYMGEEGDAKAELTRLIDEASKSEPEPQPAAPPTVPATETAPEASLPAASEPSR